MEPRPSLERCPTCGARYSGRDLCHRCGTPVGRLIAVKEESARHAKAARAAFQAADWDAMLHHARRARALHSTAETTRLLAVAALRSRRFSLAAALWRRHLAPGGS